MSAMQSFLFGAMVAWTPSLIMLGWLLWSDEDIDGETLDC